MTGRALFDAHKLHAVLELEPFLLSLAKKPNPITLTQCHQIHAKLIITQCISQTHLANTLLSFYSKSSNFHHAHQLFNKMPHRNVVTWTTLISSHLKYGSVPKALKIFNQMLLSDERPNEYTFSVLLRACSNHDFWSVGLQIHGSLVRFGLDRDKFAGSSLVYMYFKGGNDLRDALRVFNGLLERDVVAWNVMISGFAQVGDFHMVQWLFSEMRDVQGLKPDNSTFVSLLQCCYLLLEVKQIHGLVYKFGAEIDVVVESVMVDLYAKCGDVSSSRRIFDSMEEKDNFVWSSMISGYSMNNRGEEAVRIFKNMCRQRVKLDQHVLSSTLKACVEIEDLNTGVQVHGLMIKNGHQNDCFVASVLLTLYASFGDLGDVEKLFRRIDDKDIVAWNSMILARARPGHGSSHSMQLMQELRRTTSLQIESATLVAVLKSCENESDLLAGRQIHSLILKSSLCHHTLVGNALVHMYSECRLIDDAFKAFVDIEWKDDSSWSSIIGTYKQNDMELEALGLCKEMLNEGVNFTTYSLPLCFSACSQLSAICEGKQLHVLAIKFGYNRDVYVGSSIIDMYAKCGNIEESENVFSEQLEPNEVIFNAMICGYAHHGKAQQAIEVFGKLEKNCVAPNHVTFLALMSACSHAGYVEETLHLFTLMLDKYKIKPKSEHYSSLVDAYGRAGRLEEAYQIVQKDGSESAWRTLLGACRNHNNTEIGEKSAMKMIEMNPSDHAPYVLLSNIYNAEGKWEEAIKCREKMAKIHVKKDPGNSWLV